MSRGNEGSHQIFQKRGRPSEEDPSPTSRGALKGRKGTRLALSFGSPQKHPKEEEGKRKKDVWNNRKKEAHRRPGRKTGHVRMESECDPCENARTKGQDGIGSPKGFLLEQ